MDIILHKHYFTGGLKNACAKMSEIKYTKNITLCETLIAFDPAKDRNKRMRFELDMLDFRPGPGQLTSRN